MTTKRKTVKKRKKRRRIFKIALENLNQQKETVIGNELNIVNRKIGYYENQLKRL